MAKNTADEEMHQQVNKIRSLADEAKQSLQQNTSELQTTLQQQAQKLGQQMDDIFNNLQTKQSDYETAFQQKAEEIKKIVTTIESNRNNAQDIHQALQKTRDQANQEEQTISQVRGEIEKVKTDVDTQLANAKSAQQQCQKQATNSAEQAAQTKAKLESATEVLASIEEQKKNILAFYKEIENHKAKMLDIEKDGTAKFNQLKDQADIDIKAFKERTDKIIGENENLQKRVNELLAGATSGGLFRVFHDRQDFLLCGRNFWKWAVGVTSGLVVVGVFIVAWALGDKPNVIFFVRLAVGMPLLFLMYFSARQYTRERQAEEEYAFKSAISLSVEPYRKLLEQMREEEATETDFVKKLITEVFDNPVKRLFKMRKPGEEPSSESTPVEAIFQAVENLPDEGFTKSAVITAIKSVLSSIGIKRPK